MSKTFDEAVALDNAYVMHTYGRLPVEFVDGSGAELIDVDGKRYVDFLSGIGCASLGHAHPKVAEALKEQLARVWQVSNYYYVENRGELAKLLSDLLSTTTDEKGHVTGSTGTVWKSFFSNSGAESNEGAIKVARRWGEKKLNGAAGIISARQSFHGRTLATLSATGQDVFHKSFGPMPAGFASVPLNDAEALREAVENPTEATGPICAVMLECVQGEGGVWPATMDYLRFVRQLCDEKGLALIVDEVQTGCFRCGAPFAFQLAGIEPDIVSMAKGIADGFPTGAVAARAELADLMVPGDHGSTFGGNALAAAAARATLQTLVDEQMGEYVIATGEYLAKRLAALPHVTEVRGHGLMRGAQLDVPIATPLVERGLEVGLVLNHIGDSILRFLPPLVVTEAQIDEMADKLAVLIQELA
ncbi:MAG: acetylornithine/succinylornithine family transaminase [Coriobacteriales bacterium]|nr:acetylornithine/succinylornithine family transaminase [Coriobacteriales bacterium]